MRGPCGAGQVSRARQQAPTGHQLPPAQHGFQQRDSVREADTHGQHEQLPQEAVPGPGRAPARPQAATVLSQYPVATALAGAFRSHSAFAETREEQRRHGPDRSHRESGGNGAQLSGESPARTVRIPVIGCRTSRTSRYRTRVYGRDRWRCERAGQRTSSSLLALRKSAEISSRFDGAFNTGACGAPDRASRSRRRGRPRCAWRS